MISVVFVCLGNICRSPMAELMFKDMVKSAGVEEKFAITSCGTSDCEEGNPVYPPARRTLDKHGIFGEHYARQICRADIINNDYIIVMDTSNLMDVLHMAGDANGGKVYKLMSFAGSAADVADPWYTRDFDRTYDDLLRGLKAFLAFALDKD